MFFGFVFVFGVCFGLGFFFVCVCGVGFGLFGGVCWGFVVLLWVFGFCWVVCVGC